MQARDFFLREVYPKLSLPLAENYPLVSLFEGAGRHPLEEHPLLMLVALTGTGKTTALELLRRRLGLASAEVIPSRRELTDWVLFPLAQALADEPIAPVTDRVKRFAMTRRFARQVEGGMAAIFSWLYLADEMRALLLSDGIRGPNEVAYALRHFPRWQIVELTLHPMTRLRRLSGRNDGFDQAGGSEDLSFLPLDLQSQARDLLRAGEISAKAISITSAEAQNYGRQPFVMEADYPNYHRLDVDGCSPEAVADAVADIARRFM
ncbi:MAG: hypothetical protein OXG78_04490 [Chloroflexi bacterium]|nr:hypothetical protein [Chloroflexota bacterium]